MLPIVSAIKTELFKQRSPSLRESSLPPFKLIRTPWDLSSNKLFIPLQWRVLNLYFYFGEQAHKASVLGQGVTEHTADLRYWKIEATCCICPIWEVVFLVGNMDRAIIEEARETTFSKFINSWIQFVEWASFAQGLKNQKFEVSKNSRNSIFWILKNSSAAAKPSRAPRSLSNSLLT